MPRMARFVASMFDLHTWSKPLIHAADLRPDFQFMATPAVYRSVRVAAAPKGSPGFWLLPVYNDVAKHTFWRRFRNALDLAPGAADHRDWLAPMRCRPKAIAPNFTSASLPSPVRAHVTVWLWPFGWSTQIEIRFNQHLDLGEVEPIASALTGSGPAFTLDGKALSTSALFGTLAKAIVGDVAAAGSDPEDVVRVQRRVVMGLIAERGQPFGRFDAAPRLSGAERARIVSLLGRTVDIVEVNEVGEPGGRYRFVGLGGPEFAISHEQLGVVVMLRHPLDSGRRRSKQYCLMGNVRASLLAWAALGGVGAGVRPTPEMEPMIQAAGATRANLADAYRNRVFQEYVRIPAKPANVPV